MSLVRGTAINLGARLLSMALVLAITALVARLGTEVQGAFALFTSVEGVLLALFSGFGIALARRVSHHGEQPRALLGAVVVACLALGLVAAALLSGIALFGPPAYRTLWLLVLAAPVLLLAPNLAGVWLGEGRMAPMAAVSLAPPLLALAGLLLVASSLTGVLASWVLAKAMVGVVLLLLMLRAGRVAAPSFGALLAEARFIATIGVTNLIGLLNYRVGLFIIERLLGLSATGVYSIAVIVAELLWFVSGSVTQAVYGRIGTPDRMQAAATTLRVLRVSLLALIAAAPLLALAAVVLIPLLLGEAYRASLPLLAWLLPGALVFGGASTLSAYFTNHAGKPQVPARVAALSLALNAALSCVLVPRMGMAGAALAASLSYSVSVLLLLRLFLRHAGLPLRALWQPVALRRGGD